MLYYYFILALQGYCLYHAYKNKSNYYWFFIIIFIPLLGCLVYIFTHVINKNDVSNIAEEITTIINPTKKIKALEKELEFSNTFQNKINLADAYAENTDYKNAILYYENALKSNFKDDPFTLNKLIKCYFNIKNFDKVIECSNKINIEKDFKESVFYLGLSLENKGNIEDAENQLRKVNKRFSNYEERLELAFFFIRNKKKLDAKEICQDILSEINSMAKQNKRKYRFVTQEAEKIINEIDKLVN